MRQLLLPYKFKTRLQNLKRARLQIASFREIYLLVLLVVRVECCKRDSTKTTFGNNSRRLHLIDKIVVLVANFGWLVRLRVQNVLPETAKI